MVELEWEVVIEWANNTNIVVHVWAVSSSVALFKAGFELAEIGRTGSIDPNLVQVRCTEIMHSQGGA